jgi:hypothetical protein
MISQYLTPQVLIPTITSIFTGGWILKDFLLKREFYPKVKIESSLTMLAGPDSSGNFAALLKICISNQGIKRLYFDHGEFTIRCLPDGEDFSFVSINGVPNINFGKEIISRAPIFPPVWEYSWVEGNDSESYSFTILIPPTSGIISLRTKVDLREKRSDFVGSLDFFILSKSGTIEKIKTEP